MELKEIENDPSLKTLILKLQSTIGEMNMKKSKFKTKAINLFKRRAENKTFKATVAYLNRPRVRRYEELSCEMEESLHSNMSRGEIKEWLDKNREWLCLAGMVGGWTPKRLASNGELVPIDCWKHCGIKPLR